MNKPTLPLNAVKILLLCEHAEELSGQCALALRHGAHDSLLDWQTRKHTIVQELAAILPQIELADFPEVQRAVERLRASLSTESRTLADASNDLQNELLTVHAAQRRLTQARRYDTATQPLLPVGGGQLSVCG